MFVFETAILSWEIDKYDDPTLVNVEYTQTLNKLGMIENIV